MYIYDHVLSVLYFDVTNNELFLLNSKLDLERSGYFTNFEQLIKVFYVKS